MNKEDSNQVKFIFNFYCEKFCLLHKVPKSEVEQAFTFTNEEISKIEIDDYSPIQQRMLHMNKEIPGITFEIGTNILKLILADTLDYREILALTINSANAIGKSEETIKYGELLHKLITDKPQWYDLMLLKDVLYNDISTAYGKSGNLNRANYFLSLHIQAKSALKGTQTNDKTAEDYFNSGKSKYNARDIKGAIQDLTKAIEIDSKHSGAYLKRGECKSLLIGDDKGAIQDLNKAIELNNKNAKAYFNRGFCKANLEDFSGSIEDYTKAIELNPNDKYAYKERARSKNILEDKKGACLDWKKAAELGDLGAANLVNEYCK